MDTSANVLELTALPPLSPTMERAFTEAFADMSELENSEGSAVIEFETSSLSSSSSVIWPAKTKHLTSSPTPASLTAVLHNYPMHKSEIRNMSPSGDKKHTSKDAMEGKRARRSAIEKKSRQRRQNVLKTMRDEVKQLEVLYNAIAKRKEERAGESQWQYERLNDLYSTSSSAVNELQHKYSELTLVAHASVKDQKALLKLLQQYKEFQKIVKSLSDEDMEEKKQVWDSGVPPSSSFKAQFTKLTTAECYALVRDSYEEMQRFNNAEHFVSTGANFMGWTDKRKYDSRSGALQYGFTKRFPLEDAEELLTKSWDIFLDAPKFKTMSFDRSVNIRYEVLQRMSDDLVIVRRDHKIPNVETTFVSVQVIFRVQTAIGYTLCMRTIPSPEIQKMQEPHEYFYDIFHWAQFNRMYDEFGNPAGCELMSAGSIGDQNQLKSTYWLFELVCSILRAQRARRLKIEKKSRQRRQGSLIVMRDEVKVLEREYLHLALNVAKKSRQAATSKYVSEDDLHERDILLDPTQVQTLRQKFLRLVSTTVALRNKQKQFCKILNVQQLFRDLSQTLATEFVDADNDPRRNVVYHATCYRDVLCHHA
ncbi:unnamed protein product [Peronospora belbahrii]|uniref:BZIP domain-containing protein n=1 Tax=Peronospora belbahrii TaxID=622444 RepID=A0ABN8DBD9_9STRA|nr:unnamed protein product [Peronospora belbahrii]